MRQYIYILLCFCLLIISCREDEFKETLIDQPPILEGELTRGDVTGLVVNTEGEAIQDALLSLDGMSRITDKNGYFRFNNIDLDKAGGLLRIVKGEYFDNYKFVYTDEGAQSYVRVTLIETSETGRFQAGSASTITESSGAAISFPANAIAKNGAAYNGEVIVRSHWYDPSSEDLAATMPGDLRGTDNNNEQVQLATLGMMAVELYATDGSELQLAEGKTATLTFPLTDQMAGEVTSEVPLWSLNETTGVWKEEGVATLEGGSMIGEVSHFSFWNCDYPFPLVELTGILESSAGEPISNYAVIIKVRDNFMTGYGVTNSEGVFQGKVPKDEPLELIVKYCGENVLEKDLGIFSSDQNIGSQIVDFNTINKLITARLIDCFGAPLVDAYVLVKNGNKVELMVPDSEGNISGYIRGCAANEVIIKAYNPIDIFESDPITVDLSDEPLLIGDWEVCGALTEHIIYSLNGGQNNLLSEARVSFVDNELIHIRAEDDISGFAFNAQVKLSDVGSAAPFLVGFSGLDEVGEKTWGYCGTQYRNSGDVCEDLEMAISEFGSPGDWIVGTMTGLIDLDTLIVEIDARFQLVLDDSFQTGRVEGTVWNDANNDGIRDPDEASLSDISLYLYGETSQGIVPAPKIYPLEFPVSTTGDDGKYYYDGLVPGEHYEVTWFGGSNSGVYSATVAGVGDEMTDSDFVLRDWGNDVYFYEIMEFTDFESNIDLGLTANFMNCRVEQGGCGANVWIEVSPIGGVPPYEISLDGVTLPSGETRIENVSGGNHMVSVTDQSNLSCSEDLFVQEYKNNISGTMWIDVDGGIDDVYDSSDGEYVLGLLIQLLDEDGAIVQGEVTEGGSNKFRLDGIEPGTYRFKTYTDSNWEFVKMSIGGDPALDSDIDPETGLSELITFTDCDEGITLDIGLREL